VSEDSVVGSGHGLASYPTAYQENDTLLINLPTDLVFASLCSDRRWFALVSKIGFTRS